MLVLALTLQARVHMNLSLAAPVLTVLSASLQEQVLRRNSGEKFLRRVSKSLSNNALQKQQEKGKRSGIVMHCGWWVFFPHMCPCLPHERLNDHS